MQVNEDTILRMVNVGIKGTELKVENKMLKAQCEKLEAECKELRAQNKKLEVECAELKLHLEYSGL